MLVLRRLYLMAVLTLGCLALSTPAYAATGGGATLTLDSWPIILAGFVGIGATHVTELFTHYDAPQWVKSGVNLALTALAGVLITVVVAPGKTWKDYLAEIATAWIVSIFTHYTGATAWLQNLTANFGVGAKVQALVPPRRAHQVRSGSAPRKRVA